MKTKIIFLFISSVMFLSAVNAQSDYEKTQNFKKQYKQLEDGIKNASSLDECNIIGDKVAKLKNDFNGDKELLDKTLYPDNFENSFSKIEKSLEARKGDFTQIVELKTQVDTLKTQVTGLSQKNQDLIGQIKQLNLKGEKDAATISALQKLVSQLKSNIQQRDQLVRDIVDSLLSEFIKSPSTLNDAEKQSIITRIDSRDLFYNIERTVTDNIQFMKVTQMTPEDLSEMKQQYTDFNKVWKQIGPRLSDVYLNRKDKAGEIANIDAMFYDWNVRINDEMWGQINKLFREKKLSLLPFKSGDQFVNSVNSFVDDELKNYGVKSKDESENTYLAFTDSVYFKSVQPTWVPILIENNLMTEANKDSIESRIAKWKEKVAPSTGINWIYIALGAVIVALVVLLFMKSRKKPQPPVIVEEEPITEKETSIEKE